MNHFESTAIEWAYPEREALRFSEARARVCMHAGQIHTYACIYVYICVYVCMCVYVSMSIHLLACFLYVCMRPKPSCSAFPKLPPHQALFHMPLNPTLNQGQPELKPQTQEKPRTPKPPNLTKRKSPSPFPGRSQKGGSLINLKHHHNRPHVLSCSFRKRMV